MDEKLSKILKDTAGLFITYGVRSLSMDDISRELGISKKTLYQYFENKGDLIEKVLNSIVSEAVEATREYEVKGCNAIDILLAASRKISKEFSNFNPAMTFDLHKYYPEEFKRFIKAKQNLMAEAIRRNMEKGIAEGLYRHDLDVDLIARLYVFKLEAIHDPEMMGSAGFSFHKMFKVMFDSHLRGICNAKGLKYYEQKLSPGLEQEQSEPLQ